MALHHLCLVLYVLFARTCHSWRPSVASTEGVIRVDDGKKSSSPQTFQRSEVDDVEEAESQQVDDASTPATRDSSTPVQEISGFEEDIKHAHLKEADAGTPATRDSSALVQDEAYSRIKQEIQIKKHDEDVGVNAGEFKGIKLLLATAEKSEVYVQIGRKKKRQFRVALKGIRTDKPRCWKTKKKTVWIRKEGGYVSNGKLKLCQKGKTPTDDSDFYWVTYYEPVGVVVVLVEVLALFVSPVYYVVRVFDENKKPAYVSFHPEFHGKKPISTNIFTTTHLKRFDVRDLYRETKNTDEFLKILRVSTVSYKRDPLLPLLEFAFEEDITEDKYAGVKAASKKSGFPYLFSIRPKETETKFEHPRFLVVIEKGALNHIFRTHGKPTVYLYRLYNIFGETEDHPSNRGRSEIIVWAKFPTLLFGQWGYKSAKTDLLIMRMEMTLWVPLFAYDCTKWTAYAESTLAAWRTQRAATSRLTIKQVDAGSVTNVVETAVEGIRWTKKPAPTKQEQPKRKTTGFTERFTRTVKEKKTAHHWCAVTSISFTTATGEDSFTFETVGVKFP